MGKDFLGKSAEKGDFYGKSGDPRPQMFIRRDGIGCRTNRRRWTWHVCQGDNMPIDNRRNCQEERERDADATRSKRRHIALGKREHKTSALDVSRAGRHFSIR